MAAATVGGAFLSSFLNVVFDRLASPDFANLIRGKKLDRKLLQRLETTLKVVGAVLDDAEKKQFTDSNVKSWLDDLKEAVYDADDLLDEVSTKAATQKEEKVSNLFSRLNIFNVQDRLMGRVASKLEGIVVKLESILQLKNSLDLKVDFAMENNLSYRTQATDLEDVSQIYGRDIDEEAVMKLVLDDKGDEVSVVPIVGMGGVGKTTLARLIYNDDYVKQVFDCQAWVCVSEEFDNLKVTRTITKELADENCEMDHLGSLHRKLSAKLKEKRFLIVLDDVWIEDYVEWSHFIKPFQRGIRGSKILITTRSDKVAGVAQTDQPYHLSQLSNEDCWLVFANHACLSSESTENRIALEKIGKEIVRKCKGLPLAAQSLGGMLRRKRDIKDWEKILNSDIWDLSESESKIIPALRVSYHYLPPHLKRCFVYCSLYPKDYAFAKNDLILLWMAEDLLSLTKKGMTLEEVGDEYFDDLASRSFFQHSSLSTQRFVMHDLMHDLATSLGGELYLRLEKLGRETQISSKTRHLSFSECKDPISESFQIFNSLKSLRTFWHADCYVWSLDNELAVHIILKINTLRVLSFSLLRNLKVLPDSIVKLIHLRYLDLSNTDINKLPKSLGNLYNLQTLLLVDCSELTMLPDSIPNLVSLRNLAIWSTPLKEMPKGMGKLNQLQCLDSFIVGKHEDNGIEELGNLSNLGGSLEIKNLENVTNGNQAMGARMKDKKHISNLSLEWSSTCSDSQTEKDILCKLQPHQDLEWLDIKGYNGTRFPDWVGNSSYHNMKDLVLSSCNHCCMLPSLGQLPSLKTLRISGLKGLEKIDASFYKNDDSISVKPFPSLQSLEFFDMPNWEVWTPFGSDAFPLLERLKIKSCPKLKGDFLPHHLPALKILYIENEQQIASSLPSAPTVSRLQGLPPSIESIIIHGSPMSVDSMFEILANTQPTCLRLLVLTNCYDIFLRQRISEQLNVQRPLAHPHQSQHSPIVACESSLLISLALDTLQNPKELYIHRCENLESLFVSRSHSLQNLTYLEIRECHDFVSFPREGLQAPNLTHLYIRHCNELKSLPHQMNALLPKLESLIIFGCPKLEPFVEGSMPPDMRKMNIGNCEKLLGGLAWPKDGLLPSSLTYLVLGKFSSLETLNCKGLLHLTSLEFLYIYDCPKLENMEGERLPASLWSLDIHGCPLIAEQCRPEHPQIWSKISHIPFISIPT